MRLNLFFDGRKVACLEGEKEVEALTYTPEFLSSSDRFPLSPVIPLITGSQDSPAIQNFFENLLPEGYIRQQLFSEMRLNSNDIMSFLGERGLDLAGGWVVTEEDQTPTNGRTIPVSHEELSSIIDNTIGKSQPLITGSPARLSLAGAQEKIGLVLVDSGYALTEGAMLSTHILKPDALNYKSLFINEHVIMTLANAVMLPTAAQFIDNQLESYVVERFDRRRGPGGQVHPIPQIDFCQALGLPSTEKYDRDGSHITHMNMLADNTKVPMNARRILFQLIVFDILVGNRDGHLKNFSLLNIGGSFVVSPAYDLICTDAYPSLDKKQSLIIDGLNEGPELHEEAIVNAGIALGLREAAARNLLRDMRLKVETTMPEVMNSLKQPIGSAGDRILMEIEGAIRVNLNNLDEQTEVRRKLNQSY
jgi:serine/threonine-protein kinase HipA